MKILSSELTITMYINSEMTKFKLVYPWTNTIYAININVMKSKKKQNKTHHIKNIHLLSNWIQITLSYDLQFPGWNLGEYD